MKDLESKLAEYGKRDRRNTQGHNHLGQFLLDRDKTPCEQQAYPFCGKHVSVHYHFNKKSSPNLVQVRCLICKSYANVKASQWLRDRANSKKSV